MPHPLTVPPLTWEGVLWKYNYFESIQVGASGTWQQTPAAQGVQFCSNKSRFEVLLPLLNSLLKPVVYTESWQNKWARRHLDTSYLLAYSHDYSKKVSVVIDFISLSLLKRHLLDECWFLALENRAKSRVIIPGPSPYLSFSFHLGSILYQVPHDLCLASSGSHVQRCLSSLAPTSKNKIPLKTRSGKSKPQHVS